MTAETRVPLWNHVLRRPALLVWCTFLFFNPLYVMPSGLPQPGDALVFLLVPFALATWDGRIDRDTARMFRSLLWFAIWVFAVDYAWAVALWKWDRLKDFLIHPFYLFFNVAVFFAALLLGRRDPRRFLRVTVEIVYVTIFIQFAASFVYRTELYRGELFFNSPNQLGYYVLLAACLFAMTQRALGISRLRSGIAVTLCAYLAVLSASRAAAVGIAVLLFVLVLSNLRTIIVASLAAAALLTLGGPVSDAIDKARERSESAQQRHPDFAEDRGYDRIWKNPEYLLFGAGEGEYQRFAKPGTSGRELHSSFGTVVFCYGVVGLVLFGVFFFYLLRGASLRLAICLVPSLLYAVAHQGLRFTMFWVVLACFFLLKRLPASRR